MKRYKLAKKENLSWQLILIVDCETDIKVKTLESVIKGENYGVVNKKVMTIINNAVKDLESEELKKMVKQSMPLYASKIYLLWLSIYGTNNLGASIVATMNAKGIKVPNKVKENLNNLPSINEIYPDSVYRTALPNDIYNKEYEKEVMQRVNQAIDMVAKEDYNERFSLRSKAELQLRQEWHEKQLKDLRDKGVDIVWIDTHANCSKRCEPWQGKLYSISGKSGEIDSIEYQPLSNATDIYEYTKSGKAYKNGCISGFNCRHRLIAYKKGFKPEIIPQEVIDRQRENDQTQRYMERQVRKYETRALCFKLINKKLYQKSKKLAKKWTDKYIEFSKQQDIAYYPSRLDI